MTLWRRRIAYVILIALTIAAGLASRRFRGSPPGFVGEYTGDTLWAAMVYLLLAAAFARRRPWVLAAAALAFSYAIEISQLYHAPWIDAIRRTTLGGLVLGYEFVWSDLVCYTVGVAMALVM